MTANPQELTDLVNFSGGGFKVMQEGLVAFVFMF